MPLLTVGHGPDDRSRLGARLTAAGIGLVVDVRRFPGSRRNPDVRRAALEEWLPATGIGYRWDARLGGRRRLPADGPVADGWWTVAQFAAYAAHTRTAEFAAALDDLLAEVATATVAVMCSESVWWRCHRRLLADVAVLGRGVPVTHLMPDGRPTPHTPSAGGAGPQRQGALARSGSVRVTRTDPFRSGHSAQAIPLRPCAGSGGRSAARSSP